MGRVRWVVRAGGIPHLTPTLSAPRVGEGEVDFSVYGLQYTPNVFHYITVPEPDYAVASTGDFPSPKFIRTGRIRVLPAIELYDELRRWAGKVDNVSADRVLPTKPACQSELTQLPP